jgi:hypothetical protein
MKVQRLIDMLLLLNKDSDILMYNGFTDDWHDILLDTGELSKLKPDHQKRCIALEKFSNLGLPFPEKEALEEEARKVKVPKGTWEFNRYANNPNIYSFKEVYLLCGKPRGKTSHDRLGSMEY